MYAEIVGLIAQPSEASAGDKVNIQVNVRNLYSTPIYISVSGKYNNTIFYLSPESQSVNAGWTSYFGGSFIMPDDDVRVYVWSSYWTGTEWYLDDEAHIDIDLVSIQSEWKEVDAVTASIQYTPTGEWKEVDAVAAVIQVSATGEWKEVGKVTAVIHVSGGVVPCATDSDCPEGFKCVDGICVPSEPGGEFPWVWVGVGVAAVGGIAVLSKKKVKLKK